MKRSILAALAATTMLSGAAMANTVVIEEITNANFNQSGDLNVEGIAAIEFFNTGTNEVVIHHGTFEVNWDDELTAELNNGIGFKYTPGDDIVFPWTTAADAIVSAVNAIENIPMTFAVTNQFPELVEVYEDSGYYDFSENDNASLRDIGGTLQVEMIGIVQNMLIAEMENPGSAEALIEDITDEVDNGKSDDITDGYSVPVEEELDADGNVKVEADPLEGAEGLDVRTWIHPDQDWFDAQAAIVIDKWLNWWSNAVPTYRLSNNQLNEAGTSQEAVIDLYLELGGGQTWGEVPAEDVPLLIQAVIELTGDAMAIHYFDDLYPVELEEILKRTDSQAVFANLYNAYAAGAPMSQVFDYAAVLADLGNGEDGLGSWGQNGEIGTGLRGIIQDAQMHADGNPNEFARLILENVEILLGLSAADFAQYVIYE